MHSPAVQLGDVFVREWGTDGRVYTVAPLVWTLANTKQYYERFSKFKILSDDIKLQNEDDFVDFILRSGALWFDVVDEQTGESVGIVYVSDLIRSTVDPTRFVSGTYHVSMWDAKFSNRLPVQKAFVRELFKRLRLHVLEVFIPLFAGGAIRVAKKAGFIEVGVIEKAKRYNGVLFNVLHLAMLENEVP